ncbi:olfactory receptor 4K13-like [Polypterus senegalus]|uniref:olfactory receptor 4K13-like n=1 Tax=Polypterus senegalus TaxID=55291 RepID=UPI001962A59F|nr:olfactory receptor 4K13-like [Polypterus senegalus]
MGVPISLFNNDDRNIPTTWVNLLNDGTPDPTSWFPNITSARNDSLLQGTSKVILVPVMALGTIFSLTTSVFFLPVYLRSPQIRERARFTLLACVPISQTGYFLFQCIIFSLQLSQHQVSFLGCAVLWLLSNSAGGAELFSLAAMSIDRYFAVCQPLFYDGICSERNLVQVVLFIFLAPVFLPLVSFFIQIGLAGAVVTLQLLDQCYLEALELRPSVTSWRLALFGFQFFAAFFIISTSYYLVVKEAIHSRMVSQLNLRARRTMTFHMVQLMLYLFPVILYVLFMSVQISPALQPIIHTSNICIFTFAQIINPLVYGLRSSELKVFLPSFLQRSHRVNSQG